MISKLYRHPRFIPLLCFGLFASFAATLLIHLGRGSLFNSDDSLYAQVIREAAGGALWPLHFSGNPFLAKPPLAFWLSALSVEALGDREASYRLLSALSVLALLAIVPWIYRRLGRAASLCTLLALLGSPFLTEVSTRVLLDPLLLLLGFSAIFAASASETPRWGWVFLTLSLGWWTKELAILPFFSAALLSPFLRAPKADTREKSLWLGLAGFLLAMGALVLLRTLTRQPSLPSLHATTHVVAGIDYGRRLYLDTLLTDSPILWLAPLGLIPVLRSIPLSRLESGLWLLIGFQSIAIGIGKTVLPHYILPLLLASLLLAASAFAFQRNRTVRMLFVFVLLMQMLRTQTAFWSAPVSLDPAHATKQLSQKATVALSEDHPLCVVDTYFPGFRFYSNRTTLTFLTTERAFAALSQVPEFTGFVRRTSVEGLPNTLKELCGGIAVLPDQLSARLNGFSAIELAGPLVLGHLPR